jgi:RimJ/RimL family protein N-acetyltransferase
MACPVIATERLFLRGWRDADLEPFAAMNADPVVMQFFPETYTEERTRRFVERIRERWAELGYSLWAVERRDTRGFIGYVGLWPASQKAIRSDLTSSIASDGRSRAKPLPPERLPHASIAVRAAARR